VDEDPVSDVRMHDGSVAFFTWTYSDFAVDAAVWLCGGIGGVFDVTVDGGWGGDGEVVWAVDVYGVVVLAMVGVWRSGDLSGGVGVQDLAGVADKAVTRE